MQTIYKFKINDQNGFMKITFCFIIYIEMLMISRVLFIVVFLYINVFWWNIIFFICVCNAGYYVLSSKLLLFFIIDMFCCIDVIIVHNDPAQYTTGQRSRSSKCIGYIIFFVCIGSILMYWSQIFFV